MCASENKWFWFGRTPIIADSPGTTWMGWDRLIELRAQRKNLDSFPAFPQPDRGFFYFPQFWIIWYDKNSWDFQFRAPYVSRYWISRNQDENSLVWLSILSFLYWLLWWGDWALQRRSVLINESYDDSDPIGWASDAGRAGASLSAWICSATWVLLQKSSSH